MKHNFYRFFFTVAAIIAAHAWISPAMAQTSYGSITGTQDDTYVINNDRTNVWTSLRLQTSTDKQWIMTNSGSHLCWSLAGNANFSDTGVEMMRMTNGGRFGIGVMDPQQKLHVGGNIRWGTASSFGLLSDDQGASIKLRGVGAIPYLDFVNDATSDFDFRFIQLDKKTFRIQMATDAVLDVWGILRPRSIQVSNNPNGALEVNGNIQISNATVPMGLTTEVGGTTPILNMGVNFRETNKNTTHKGAAFRIDPRDTKSLFQWISRSAGSTTEKFLMELKENGNLLIMGDGTAEGGNVGIGTATPTKGKLQVVGSFHVENNQGKQTFHVSAQKQLVFIGDSAYTQYIASAADPSSPIQQDNFSLWVSKGIVSEDFAIATAEDWADFVFDENYDLQSLAKVEAYIREHGHLPEMPAADEVKEKGYSMHNINRKLLQKIEELTLYAIEQEKKMEKLMEQNSRLDELASRLSKLENSK